MTKGFVLVGMWMVGCVRAFGAVDAPAAVDWQAKLPLIRVEVRHRFPRVAAEAHYPASIVRTTEVAPGVTVALVDLGTGGYTEEITVMRLEGDTPVAAQFRGRDKQIGPKVFLSGFSENKGEALEVAQQDHVVFAGHWVVNGAKLKKCGGEAYQWDASAKDFGFEKKLTKSMAKDFCQKMGAKLGH
jgi:hypothetical protein